MKVVEVIPVVKGITKPTLSYFTKERFAPGSFVRVPLRSGSTMGIVVLSTEASKQKSALKKADFALKKLKSIEKAGNLSAPFMQAVAETARFYAASPGSVLSALLPKVFLESPELLGKTYKEKAGPERDIRLLQLSELERFREYRSIVRECFARKTSVLFIAPTKEEVNKAADYLSTGIEDFVFVGKGTGKKLKNIIEKARGKTHPILFITTPSLLAFERPDIDTVILERENSRAYQSLRRPFIHIKAFLKLYAKERGSALIMGDSLLSLESLWHEREGRYIEISPLTWRLKLSETELIDMRRKKGFEVLSERLRQAIASSLAEGKHVFLFAARKGLSPSTVCGDCGALLLCKNCGAPMVLHEPPFYACHHCGARRSAETRCDNCQSWKLTPLGVGVDRVVEECRSLFPEAEVLVADKDHVPTEAKTRSVMERFKSLKGGILVGTELSLPYLSGTPLVAAVSLDSLFSIPDFYINERIFYLITRLRELAKETFIIQSRNAGEDILQYAAAGNILDFYRSEIAERQELMYPPFSIFIKVSTRDTEYKIPVKASMLRREFGTYEPHFMLEGKQKGLQELSIVMRLPRESWPDAELGRKLLLLPQDFLVRVDPESIL